MRATQGLLVAVLYLAVATAVVHGAVDEIRSHVGGTPLAAVSQALCWSRAQRVDYIAQQFD